MVQAQAQTQQTPSTPVPTHEGGGEAEKLKAAAKAMKGKSGVGDKTVLAAYRNDLKTTDIKLSLVRRNRKREGDHHCQRIGGGTAGEKMDCCGGGQKPYY